MTALVERFQERFQLKRYPIGIGRIITYIVAVIGISVMVTRWIKGIGATSALLDARGWGLWITYDIMAGVAIATGGFMIAGIAYILNLKEFHPLVRPTVLTALIGYILAASTLLIDLGFPFRIWHLIIYWNYHSPLFEVGWCVMLYLAVLLGEFSPAIFESFGWKVPLKIARAITIPLVITGIVLSTMHQSTLGTLLLAETNKIYPLWTSGVMPVLYFSSAVPAGIAMMVFEGYLSAKVYHFDFEHSLFKKLVKIIPWTAGFYFLLRMVDFFMSGDYQYLFQDFIPTLLFFVENLIFLAAIILFSMKKIVDNPWALMWTSLLMILGAAMFRFDAALVFMGGPGYAPSWTEWAVSLGFTAIGVIMYDVAVRLFPVFEHEGAAH